jgi:S1-C subfamily serine protease
MTVNGGYDDEHGVERADGAVPPVMGQVSGTAPAGPSPSRRAARRRGWGAAGLVGLVLAAGAAGAGIASAMHNGGPWAAWVGRVTGERGPVTLSDPLNVASVAAKVDPAVVDINVTLAFGQGVAEGTGMLLTPDGLVLTNNHVVEGAGTIRVKVAGRSSAYTATVVGVDPTADVALLKLEGASGLPTVRVARTPAALGEPVVAIGNALGLGGSPTVTSGTVTALGRAITAMDAGVGSEHLTGLIQTNAGLQPGDSGGPLVNSLGQVVGMDTAAQASGSQGNGPGLGFAIPMGRAMAIVNAIRAGHTGADIITDRQALLGVDLFNGPPSQMGAMLPNTGALVWAVLPGTAASEAGLQRGDVITAFDGHAITSAASLGQLVRRHKPGTTATVTWTDLMGQPESATVTLGTAPVP